MHRQSKVTLRERVSRLAKRDKKPYWLNKDATGYKLVLLGDRGSERDVSHRMSASHMNIYLLALGV